ncbi:MAG: hypothetical protein QOI01_760 [Mycobacterium sp.]|nr:hypothetical protein [Mycobacterium sp.]
MAEVCAVGDGRHLDGMDLHVGETRSAACRQALPETIQSSNSSDTGAVGGHDRLQVASLGIDRRHGDHVGEQRAGGAPAFPVTDLSGVGIPLGSGDCREVVNGLDIEARTVGTSPYRRDALTIDRVYRDVWVDGEPVHLTFREFELLSHLAVMPGRAVSRENLLRDVWRDGATGSPRASSRTVSTRTSGC